MNSSEDEGTVVKRRKGVVNQETYKRNVIIKAKVSGKEYVKWAGKTVPAKTQGSNDWR